MTTFACSTSRRCYTSTNLSSREKFPRRMKNQDLPSTIEARKAQWASTIQPRKSTALTLMGAGPQRTRRKILGLRNQKTETGPSTPEKSTTTKEIVTQAGDEAKGKAKIDHCTVCITKEI
jgi:hypothetical protein